MKNIDIILRTVNKEVSKMCNGCFNQQADGKCSLPWISPADQKINAKSGFCEESTLIDTYSVITPTRQIKISGKWYTMTEQVMKEFFRTEN